MLRVVQDEQERTPYLQHGDKLLPGIYVRLRHDQQRLEDRFRDALRVGQIRQRYENRGQAYLTCSLHRQTCLPDTARSRERDQPVGKKQTLELLSLRLTSEEAGQVERKSALGFRG